MAREHDDHAIFEAAKSKNSPTGYTPKITRPSDVLYVPDVEELKALLEQYANPFTAHVVPDSAFARKHYVEKVRPALRFYCKKFDVPEPKWLESDDHYKNMGDEEKLRLFGTTELSFRKFRPVNRDHGIQRMKDIEQAEKGQ